MRQKASRECLPRRDIQVHRNCFSRAGFALEHGVEHAGFGTLAHERLREQFESFASTDSVAVRFLLPSFLDAMRAARTECTNPNSESSRTTR